MIRRGNRARARRASWVALLPLLAASGGQPAAQVKLPDFGDPSATVISPSTERALGEEFMRQLRITTTLVDDPHVEEYIQSLGYGLIATSQQQDLGFNFFVVKDRAINAFAAPGGWVGVHSGLVLATERESELASVIAHEIAHVTQRHIARAIALNERSNVAVLAGILAAIAIGTQNSQAGQAAAAAVIGGSVQNRLNFSRANEQEADRVGMQLLDASGFDPASMASFFEKLQSAARYYRSPPEYLSTHPVTTSRIADARARAEQLGFRQHPDSIDYLLVRAKLRVLTEPDDEKLLSGFEEALGQGTAANDAGLRFGYALAKARSDRHDEARAELEALAVELPESVPVRVALAEQLAESGDRSGALSMLDDLYRLLPDSRLVVRSYVRALSDAGRTAQVLRVLDDYRRLSEEDAEMLRLRAKALAAQGREADSQAALAEHYYKLGQLDAAIQQLTLAARNPGNDFYMASRVEARLDELRSEQARRARR